MKLLFILLVCTWAGNAHGSYADAFDIEGVIEINRPDATTHIPIKGSINYYGTKSKKDSAGKKHYYLRYKGTGRFEVLQDGSTIGSFTEDISGQFEYFKDGRILQGYLFSTNFWQGQGWGVLLPPSDKFTKNSEFMTTGYYRVCSGQPSTCRDHEGVARVRITNIVEVPTID